MWPCVVQDAEDMARAVQEMEQLREASGELLLGDLLQTQSHALSSVS